MEIDFSDLNVSQHGLLIGLGTLVALVVLLALGWVGQPVTPYSAEGQPRFFTLADWHLLQAERAYQRELGVLRADAGRLAQFLNGAPNPVEVQLAVEEIQRHTASGETALAPARQALRATAGLVLDWSVGVLAREEAAAALNALNNLLVEPSP